MQHATVANTPLGAQRAARARAQALTRHTQYEATAMPARPDRQDSDSDRESTRSGAKAAGLMALLKRRPPNLPLSPGSDQDGGRCAERVSDTHV